jgi:hypothetical protein
VSISANDFWAFSGAPLNVSGSGATGDTDAQYMAPAATPAQSLNNYSTWNGAGINSEPINTSLIGPESTGPHPY